VARQVQSGFVPGGRGVYCSWEPKTEWRLGKRFANA
jgi:hypothetical protein